MMGDKKTTKNLLYLFGVVVIISAALLIYGSYENKAQAPEASSPATESATSGTISSADLDAVNQEISNDDDLSSDDLNSIQSDVDSIDLSDI